MNKNLQLKKQIRKQHFSLMELMVVLIIIGLLTALVGPPVINKISGAKQDTARTQIKLLSQALKDYYLDMDEYPQRLDYLVEDPGSEKWDGPYLDSKHVPLDPWGNEYNYRYPGDNGDFDLSSYGKDGTSGGDDEDADINSWE